MIRRYATTAAALLFFLLWQRAERQEERALAIAAETVATTAECIASYGDSARQMGTAVADLTNALRTE